MRDQRTVFRIKLRLRSRDRLSFRKDATDGQDGATLECDWRSIINLCLNARVTDVRQEHARTSSGKLHSPPNSTSTGSAFRTDRWVPGSLTCRPARPGVIPWLMVGDRELTALDSVEVQRAVHLV